MSSIKPQPGYQDKFLSCPADVLIGGSGAGVGKTFALLLDALRGVRRYQGYRATIFRESYQQITMQGGLWDESKGLYTHVGGLSKESKHWWDFGDTASQIAFRYLSHEDQLEDWGGSQIPYIGFDELTAFTKKMFIYMLTRNRIGSSIKPLGNYPLMRPKMRGTCNPDPDSWLSEFLEWYIDQETGFPIVDRAGLIRYFAVDQDTFVFGDTRDEVYDKARHIFEREEFKGIARRDLIKSLCFIPGNIFENKELLNKNPGYLANLLAQSEEEQLRLLKGNWKVRADGLSLFEWQALEDMFSNIIPEKADDKYYITIDHAREGQDLCVIGVWKGWRLIRIDALTKSDTNDIVQCVNANRSRYRPIPVSQIIVDQDGIGVKDALRCHLFQGGASQWTERREGPRGLRKIADRFENKKTQMFYHTSEKVNAREVFIDLNNIYVDGVHTKQVKQQGKLFEIRKRIKDDLRVVKRENPDALKRKKVTDKKSQKNALGGLSPDWGDMINMRSEFEYIPVARYLSAA